MTTTSCVVELADALAHVSNGQTIALGGEHDARRPVALARELIRRGARDLTVTGWAQGLDVALLLDAGAAARADVLDGDTGWFAFLAASLQLPYLPLTDGSDGRVSALRPDVALIHAEAATTSGVVLSWQERHGFERDRALAAAAGAVIVSVEQVVSDLTAERHRDRVLIDDDRVRAVVLAPFGSHPTAMPGRYLADEQPRESQAADHGDHWSYLDAQGIGRLIHAATDTLTKEAKQ